MPSLARQQRRMQVPDSSANLEHLVVRLRLLGPTELVDERGAECSRILAQPKRLALLAYLALGRGFHRRDSLLALFWPELDPARCRDALNQSIRFLRQELGDAQGSLILSRGTAELAIDASRFWCDVLAFRDAVEAGRQAEALELYRGDLLPGFFSKGADGFEEWLEAERPRLRLAAARAARELANRFEREGDPDRAVMTARRAVELAGLDERTVRDLLTRLDRLGDRAGALAAYDAFAARLATELGAAPSAETQSIVERMRNGRAGSGAGPATAWTEGDAMDGARGRRTQARQERGRDDGYVAGSTIPAARTDPDSLRPSRGLGWPGNGQVRVARAIHRRTVFAGAIGVGALVVISTRLPLLREAEPKWFSVDPPPGVQFNQAAQGLDIAISPDGETLAFVAGLDRMLFVSRRNQGAPMAFPQVKGISDLHFSPDGSRLVYRSGGATGGPTVLRIEGGPGAVEPVQLARLTGWSGITWGVGRDVIYAWNNALWRAAPNGGMPSRLAVMDTARDRRWRHPVLLGDGKTIAFAVTPAGATAPDADSVALISINGGARTILPLAAEGVIGHVAGALLFSRRSSEWGRARIMAIRMDPNRRRVVGDPVVILDSVDVKGEVGAMAVLSANGTLAYLTSNTIEIMQIVDAQGAVFDEVKGFRGYRQTAWSPDGRRIALFIGQGLTQEISVYDVETRVLTRLRGTDGFAPMWTPDSRRIAYLEFGPDRGPGRAMWIAADGSGGPEVIPGTESLGWSLWEVLITPDSRHAVVRLAPRARTASTPQALMVPLDGAPIVPFITESPAPYIVRFSPNGRWVSYHAAEGSDSATVFVRSLHGDGRVQIPPSGGYQARWSGDSRRLFYRTGTSFRVATLDIDGPLPRVLRDDSVFADASLARSIASFDVHPDGHRFAVTRDVTVGARTTLKVIENVGTLVRRKLAAR